MSNSGPALTGISKGVVHPLLGKTWPKLQPDFTAPGIAKEWSKVLTGNNPHFPTISSLPKRGDPPMERISPLWWDFPTQDEPFKIAPKFYWEFSIFSSGFWLDFPFPNVYCCFRILSWHLDNTLASCHFIIMHSESPTHTSWASFSPQSRNLCPHWPWSLTLTGEWHLGILEFHFFSLNVLFYYLFSFRHTKDMSNARLCFLYGLSLWNKGFIFILAVQDFYQECWEQDHHNQRKGSAEELFN